MSENAGWESVNVYRMNLEIDKTTRIPKEASVHKPEDARDIVNLVLGLNNSAVEKFGFIAVDAENKVIGVQVMSVGGSNMASVEEDMLFRAVLLSFAEGIILFHNHPSGNVQPSYPDIELTRKFIDSGSVLSIPVYDHIIVTQDDYHSMHEKKDCKFKKPRKKVYLREFFPDLVDDDD
ncbi:MAG: hypothetical protein FWE04_06670 [Oscillospiraceae bacterium]|nr:hypothetical protein [Oscillospiraceae bacterium]